MNNLLKRFFDKRGYTPDYLYDINNVDYNLLEHIDEMCSKLYDIKSDNKRLVILPDFDMDGIMSGVLSFAGFAELGFNVSLYIPDVTKGYGFDSDTIIDLLHKYPDTDAIITCDTGITCKQGIKTAFDMGVDTVLVTDHHIQLEDSLATVVVDPMSFTDSYKHPQICGAFVIWQILSRYAELYCDKFMQVQIDRLRVFAGIGTVSDSMPVLYENRQLLRDSISICRYLYGNGNGDKRNLNSITGCDIYRRAFSGLFTALYVFAEQGKIASMESIDENFYGFYLAPVFNSVKRMGADSQTAFGVFFGTNPNDCMYSLYELNEQRKETVINYMNEIMSIDQPYKPYIYITTAPAGICGLLAQKIMIQTGLPCCVVHQCDDGSFNGSGRSPEWYPAVDVLLGNGFSAAGHQTAFGVKFKDEPDIMNAVNIIDVDIKNVMDNLPVADNPDDIYDLVIATDGSGDTTVDIFNFFDFIVELNEYKPFGKGFEEPNILVKFNANEGEWSCIGSMKQHLKITLPLGFDILLWNQADKFKYANSRKEIRIEGKLGLNEYMDNVSVNFVGTMQENEGVL